MDETQHQPGQLDFSITEKNVSLTAWKRKPSAVWTFLDTPGHVIFLTYRGKPKYVIMSIETYACLSGDYEGTMRKIEEDEAAEREEQKEKRREAQLAKKDSDTGGVP